ADRSGGAAPAGRRPVHPVVHRRRPFAGLPGPGPAGPRPRRDRRRHPREGDMRARTAHEAFVIESREILEALTKGLLALERGEATPPVLGELLRRAHTLKGAANVVRRPAVAEMAHMMEDVLVAHRDSGEPLSAREIGELLHLLDALEAQLAEGASEAEGGPVQRAGPAGSEPSVLRIELASV